MKKIVLLTLFLILIVGFTGISSCIEYEIFESTEGPTDSLTQETSLTKTQDGSSTASIGETVTQSSPTKIQQVTVLPTKTSLQLSLEEMFGVVEVVEKYFEDYKGYLESIEELIPEYLDDVPFTHEEQEILYRKDQKLIYVVGFYIRPGEACNYLKSEDYYECGPWADRLFFPFYC